jgi:magnesium chelatase family protein
MVQRVTTVAFEGIEARAVDVQVQVAPGLPAFNIVGLPDKAVSEAKERVRAALVASGLALPARRITVNLAPADLPKEGSHYDLPIALGLMAAIGAIQHDTLNSFTVLGELGLDGSIAAVAGVLPAAIGANGRGQGLICPSACGPEAAWASPEIEIVAAQSLIQLANHFKGTQVLMRPQPKIRERDGALEHVLRVGALSLLHVDASQAVQPIDGEVEIVRASALLVGEVEHRLGLREVAHVEMDIGHAVRVGREEDRVPTGCHVQDALTEFRSAVAEPSATTQGWTPS